MRTAQPDKRTRLIETATKLAYGRGFRETSLADIAKAARVPVGNVYYYLKTKEELAEAVVERRLEEFRADRAEWNRLSSPKERLLAFVGSVQANREQLARGGCALGGLCTELHKEGGALAKKSAALFNEPMRWLEEQFRAVGHEKDSRSQGPDPVFKPLCLHHHHLAVVGAAEALAERIRGNAKAKYPP